VVILLGLASQHYRFAGLAIFGLASVLNLAINVFFFSILIQVVISWINPMAAGMNPAVSLLHTLNEPILGRARKLIKPIHGFDLSPIVAAVVLQLMKILLVSPLVGLSGINSFFL